MRSLRLLSELGSYYFSFIGSISSSNSLKPFKSLSLWSLRISLSNTPCFFEVKGGRPYPIFFYNFSFSAEIVRGSSSFSSSILTSSLGSLCSLGCFFFFTGEFFSFSYLFSSPYLFCFYYKFSSVSLSLRSNSSLISYSFLSLSRSSFSLIARALLNISSSSSKSLNLSCSSINDIFKASSNSCYSLCFVASLST